METFESLKSVISLFISLLALVGIVWLYLSFGKNYKPETRNARLLYISGYGAFIILELIVYIVMGNDQKDDIISVISFGATLSSLIMSVVAIIFTIVSGKDGREQLGRITQATKELQTTATTISNFQTVASELSSSIVRVEKKLGMIDDRTLAMQKNFSSIMSLGSASGSAGNSPAIDVKNYIDRGSMTGCVLLLSCALSKEYSKKFEINLFDEKWFPHQYCFGYTIASASIGVISISGNWPDITIEDVSKNLKEYALDFVKRYLVNPYVESRDVLKIEVNKILAYYGEPEIP